MVSLMEIEHIHDLFRVLGIEEFDLPQISVVGMKSSGKSSVLEQLIGRRFLPRGPGGVTKCPLVLHLINSRGSTTTNDYGIFQHKTRETFDDYQSITKEIKEQMEILTSSDTDMCSTAISLTLFSKTFTNLTLIDLPGITNNNEQQSKELILKYIDKPNSIILVVTPANVDIAKCEGLKLAREVDPNGARTLVVVTKLDLMDQGTDARAMLCGNTIPVKLGIIGVVNLSEKNISNQFSFDQTCQYERDFLNKYYKDIKSSHGIPCLLKNIHTILLSHIIHSSYLPGLNGQINRKLKSQKLKLSKLGIAESDSLNFIQNVIFKFNNLHAMITGTLDSINTKELNGAVKINEIFRMANNALKKICPLKGLSENDITMALNNGFGVNVACYIPRNAFELLVKKQIKQLHKPCLKCVCVVHEELINMVYNCVNDPTLQITDYPNLQKMLIVTALDFLENHYQTTKRFVNNIFDIHSAYINYDHKDFLSIQPKKERPKDIIVMSHPQNSFSKSIQTKVHRYFSVVRRSIMDILPKLIMCFMVNSMVEGLHLKLVTQLNHMGLSDLLQESPELQQKRKSLNEAISVLENADKILNSLKSSNVHSKKLSTFGLINHQVKVFCNHLQKKYAWVYRNNYYLLILASLFFVVVACIFSVIIHV